MNAITFAVPMPPSLNHMYERNKRHLVKSKSYKTWLSTAYWMLIHQRNFSSRFNQFSGDVQVSVRAYRQETSPDLDNILKPIMDLLSHSQTIKDDKQVIGIDAAWVDEGVPCQITVRPA